MTTTNLFMTDYLSLPAPTSALSSGVKKLIYVHDDPNSPLENVKDLFTSNRNINFGYLEQILPSSLDQTAEYFQKATQVLSPVCKYCEEHLSLCTPDFFNTQYSHFLQWTGNEKLFIDCFNLLVNKSQSDDVLVLLLVTSGLERALGDVFLIKGQQCPSMLKDLLVTSELNDIFGPVVIQTLRILIGPPVSLNLRNLVWHGFPKPEEIPQRYAWFLLLLVPSLGEILHHQAIDATSINHRPPVSFYQTEKLQEKFPSFTSYLSEIGDIFCQSEFIQGDFLPLWKKILELYKNKSFGLCLVLMLPQLEHALRRVFAAVNNCPERILTAESAALYTTFDEILDKYLPSGEENEIVPLIGESCMDLLFDLLVYPEGPRIRDRLSHGEVLLNNVSVSLVNPFVCLSVSLCQKFIKDDYKSSVIDVAVSLIEEYHSLFHPVALLKTQVLKLLEYSAVSSPWIANTPQLKTEWISQADCDKKIVEENEICVKLKISVLNVVRELVKQFDFGVSFVDLTNILLSPFAGDISFITKILEQKTSTLFRGQQQQLSDKIIRESEIVNLLQRVTTECQITMSQINNTINTRLQQLHNKQLRSRQRENLHKLIESIPSLYLMHQLNILIVTFHVSCLDTLTSASQETLQRVCRFLKMYLKFCENERTNTAPDRNKWKESLELFSHVLPKCLTYFTDCVIIKH